MYWMFLFINFYAIRYRDTVEQTTCTFSCSIRANECVPLDVRGGRRDYNTGVNQAGKCGHSLFNCISVMDGIKINEQNELIGKGPLYIHTEFEAKVIAGLNPVRYQTLQYWHSKTSKCILPW